MESKTETCTEEVKKTSPDENEQTENFEKEAETTSDSDDLNIEEILQMKIKLKDGSESFLFSRGPAYPGSNDLPSLNCHLCRVGKLLKDDRFKSHIKGRKHKTRVNKPGPEPDKYLVPFRQYYGKADESVLEFKVNPGENIPEVTPEYQDRISKKDEFEYKPITDAEILKALDDEPIHEYNKKLPVLGLCYAFKMKNVKSIQYYCVLCRSQIRGEAYQHFVGANHQANYILKHFPKLYEEVVAGLKKITDSSENELAIRNIFRKLYRKIENAKGLCTITKVDFDDFMKNRTQYLRKCKRAQHYGENTITITPEEVKSLIGKSLRRIEFIKQDMNSLPVTGGDQPVVRKVEQPKEKDNRKRSVQKNTNWNRASEPPVKSNRDVRRQFASERPDWEKYRVMITRVLDEINDAYNKYDRFPKSHPFYETEWKKFWRRRCNELKRDNINPRNYDFDKEWGPFWLNRLQELYAKDVAKQKFELKRTLNLPYDTRSPSPVRSREIQKSSPAASTAYNNSWYPDRPTMQNIVEDIHPKAPAEPVSVISVMRLLTALEDQLGSLGPKAVQLLSRAVLFEKNNQNPNELLLDNDLYVFFATAKEKLKGQLMADIVEPNKLRAVTNTVDRLSILLGMFEKYMRQEGMNKSRNNDNNYNRNCNDMNINKFNNNSNNINADDQLRNNNNDIFNNLSHSSSYLNRNQNQQSQNLNVNSIWQSGASLLNRDSVAQQQNFQNNNRANSSLNDYQSNNRLLSMASSVNNYQQLLGNRSLNELSNFQMNNNRGSLGGSQQSGFLGNNRSGSQQQSGFLSNNRGGGQNQQSSYQSNNRNFSSGAGNSSNSGIKSIFQSSNRNLGNNQQPSYQQSSNSNLNQMAFMSSSGRSGGFSSAFGGNRRY